MGELKQADIGFLVSATLNAMSPIAGRTGQTGTQVNRTGGDLRAGSLTFTGSRDAKRPARISGSLYQATFLCKRRQIQNLKANEKRFLTFSSANIVHLFRDTHGKGMAKNRQNNERLRTTK